MAEKRTHIVWMLQELPRLRSENLITEETETVLTNHYRSRLDSLPAPQKLFAAVLACIGIVMVAAGIILFLNYNWDMFPKALRMGISAVPLVIGAVLGYVTIARAKGQLWCEAAAVFTATGAAVLISMLSQIYHINGEMGDYIFLVLLLAVLPLYLFDSIVLAALYVLFSFFLVDAEPWRCGVTALCFLPLLLGHLRENAKYAVFFRYLAGPAALFALIGCCGAKYYAILPGMALCGLFIVSGTDLVGRGAGLLKTPWLLPAFALQTFLLAAGSGEDCSLFDVPKRPEMPELWVYWVFTAAVLVLFLLVFMRRRLSEERALNALFVLLTLIPFATDVPVMRLVCNVALGLGGIICLRGGFVRRSILLFNGGAVMVATLTACRFFDAEIGVLYRSAGLILLGLGFIIANVVFMKKSGRA